MALVYLDTSALAKRYVPEVGSAWIARLCTREPVAVSLLTFPELASALARRTHEGTLSAQQRDVLFRAFVRDAQLFTVVAPDQAVTRKAATLLLSTPVSVRLRALDALHLASAQLAFARATRRGIDTGSFITSDRPLLVAAQWVGLSTLNPEHYP